MTGVLIRREKPGHRGDWACEVRDTQGKCRVVTEAAPGVMLLQTKEHQGWMEVTRSSEGARKDFPQSPRGSVAL